MFSTTLPAGNHVIRQVQYHAPSTQTLLALCCGLMAYMTLADTQVYKPEPGDYYIVTDHGTASLVKKAVFDGATKPMGPTTKKQTMYISDMFGTYILDPFMVGLKMDTQFPFERGQRRIAKPETRDMREENGYVTKAVNAMCQANEAASQANAVYTAKDFGAKGDGVTDDTKAIQNALNYKTPTEATEQRKVESTMTEPQKAVQDFLVKHKTELDKLQNIINSLTAQNEKKQAQITELQRQLRIRTDVGQRLNRLIDVCSKAKLI